MKDELYEELSRLLEDDLPPDRADAMRRRIDTDPEVRAAWDAVRSLAPELAGLPDELPPPTELDARVLGPTPRTDPARPTPWLLPCLVALAAVALGWLLRADPPAQLVLAEGTQWVEGAAVVRAGAHRVEVDGSARIDVEPSSPVARGSEAATTEDAMRKDLVTAAAAGAVVTLTVYEGRAWLRPADAASVAPPAEVRAGERRVIGAPERASSPARSPDPAPPEATATIARLEQELERARQALAQAEFTSALARGQLAAERGDALPFPDGVPATFAADAFAEAMQRRLAEIPGAQLEQTDCGEYPCLAVVRASDPGTMDQLVTFVEQLADESYEGAASVAVRQAVFARDGEPEAQYVVFGVWGDHGEELGLALRQRTGWRLEQAVSDIDAQVHGP